MTNSLTTKDYIYIEALGIVLYYYQLEENARSPYANLTAASERLIKNAKEMSPALLKELIMQDSVAFEVGEGGKLMPCCVNNLQFVSDYLGNLSVTVVANTNENYIPLVKSNVDILLESLTND